MAASSRKKRRVAEERSTLIGQSAAFLELVRRVDAVAPTESTVLLSGEAGVGKTLIATAIHDRSARRGRPAVVVDAAAVRGIRSALFGRKGGALARAAKGGTVIFEEVGQLDMEIQARLRNGSIRATSSRSIRDAPCTRTRAWSPLRMWISRRRSR